MAQPFTHLHVHSHYSLLAGAWAPEEIARAAARQGLPAIALTDTDGLYGAVPFAKACAAAGVRMILGAELTDPARAGRGVFLARDQAGYEALCALVSARHLDAGFTLRDAVARRSPHLALLTRDHRLLEVAVAAGRRDGTYAEVRPAPDGPAGAAERALRRETLAWAARLDLPPVATAGAYYEAPPRRDAHRVLRAIGTRTTLAALAAREADRAGSGSGAGGAGWRPGDLETGPVAPTTAWLQPGAALAAAFADCPAAIENAGAVAAACRFGFRWGAFHFPTYPTAPGESAFAMLWRLAFEGLAVRYRPLPDAAIRRLQEELEVIEAKGFADYFLVIRDIARWAAAERIPSVGRGSAANSLVSFCLGITHVDPLRHRLFFERFLSRERADAPDFDLDFCWRRRERVVAYVSERFGAEHVAMIATFCRLGARGALREVARALGVPDREIGRVTRRLPHGASVAMLPALCQTLPECRGLGLDRPPWDAVVALALQIDMYPRHPAVHSGGIVIGPRPLDRYLPRQRAASGVVVTQFDMYPVEDVGLVKIDLLGNRGLSVIADVSDALRETEGLEIAWAHDEDAPEEPGHVNPFRDPATRAILRAGRTMGCFYIESPSMRGLLRKLRCDSFEMLTAASSIIRPGISDSGMMDAFIRRFRGDEPVVHLHPVMAELLGDTYGVMIYQEDVIKVVHRLAGMSLGEADGLRRAMSKKRDFEDFGAHQARFLAGTQAHGVAPDVADEIWRQIESFAGYSFCKAHSASYAQVSFQSAWLKAHYPGPFMAAVLANGGGFYPAFAYVEEARRLGLAIRLPDINRSAATWSAESAGPGGGAGAIRAGFGQIGELPETTVARILGERARGGPFIALGDFCARVPVSVTDAHRLIDAGCFDAFDLTRPQAKCRAELALQGWLARPEAGALFAPAAWAALEAPPPPVPGLADYPVADRRRREWELLGVSVHHHPLEFAREAVAAVRRAASPQAPAITADAFAGYAGRRVTLVGFLTSTKRVRTTHGEPMMFLTLEDETDLYDAVLFPRVYQRAGHQLRDRGPYILVGRIEDDPHPSTVMVERLERLADRA
ncbi:MAG: DNA polymerase III subunit alpha [Gemmatimonadota bacterium]